MSALLFQEAKLAFRVRGTELWALGGISAAVEACRVTAIVGPNGAGKTSLVRAAAGLVTLTSGSCAVLDRPLASWPRDALARQVAYLPQTGDAAWPLPARDVVALGRMPHGARLGALVPRDAEAVERAMARADVLHLASRRVDQLSAGERARVLFARALATEAKILLADEPAAHLDPAHQLRLMKLLQEEAARGACVLVTLHELALASSCDRVLVLDRGRLAAEGDAATALSDGVLADVFKIRAIRAARPSGGSAPIPDGLL